MQPPRAAVIPLLVLLSCEAEPIWTVCKEQPAPWDNLQAAVDDSQDGDVITVCPGSWGPVEINGRSLTLRGAGAATVARGQRRLQRSLAVYLRRSADLTLTGASFDAAAAVSAQASRLVGATTR